MDDRIYLDNNATTRIDPLVLQTLTECYLDGVANPSSIHWAGQQARSRLAQARSAVAERLGVRPRELIFTGSGTEALNLLLFGLIERHNPTQILTTKLEHSAVYSTLHRYAESRLRYIETGAAGAVTPDQLEAAITPDTGLIVLMAVNNETGAMLDVEAIAALAESRGIPLVIDGVAWIGKEPLKGLPSGVTGLAFSAHKFHGPRGIGAAVVRGSRGMPSLLSGGAQEQGLRSGTEDIPSIVAMARAFERVEQLLPAAVPQMRDLRDLFEQLLMAALPGVQVNGEGPRVSNTSNLYFPHVSGEALLMSLDLAGVAASHGSACAAGALEPSRVLLEMGYSHERASSSLRFSLCRETTEEQIREAVRRIVETVNKLSKR